MDGQFNLKIIPKFDRTGAMNDWIGKLELVCDQTGGAFMVYWQLTMVEKLDVIWIEEILIAAFAADSIKEVWGICYIQVKL